MPDTSRGVILALSAAFWGTLFLIPYKAATARADLLTVAFAMVLCAAVSNSIASLIQTRGRLRCDRTALLTALVLGACTVLGNIAMAASLARVEPAITSVVLQLQIILVGLAEFVVLRVRPTRPLLVGAVLALVGFLVMQAPWSVADPGDLPGAAWALLAALSFTVMLVTTRRVIARIDPLAVNALRLWLATACLAALPGAFSGALALDRRGWLLVAGAALCGPTISRMLLMYAVGHISATHTKLITLVSPVLALIMGWLAFGEWPSVRECLGGAIILCGVALPLLRHASRLGRGSRPGP